MLTPERGIVMFVSQIVEQQEKDLHTEKWYGTKWTKAKMDDGFIAKLRTIVPGPEERLGYPPVNKYIPKQLIEKKKPRPEGTDPALPIKISESPSVWFKQDDNFNQPFTFCELKIETTDCMYPLTPLSHVFSAIWNACLSESLREISYMAELAGQGSGLTRSTDFLHVSFAGYNDGLENYIEEVFQSLQTFKVEEQFFNDKKAVMIRGFENEKKKEPYQRLGDQI